MKVAYLVDTDWIIDHLNGKSQVTAKLTDLQPAGIALSIISLAELYEGVYWSRDPVKSASVLTILLSQFPTLGIDEEVCKTFGKERGRLRRAGKAVGDLDLMIASTCLRWDITLLTNNRRHYAAVGGLNMLSLT